ncbi:phiSA1p31-related protein [Streptomyces sp. NPDC056352]|uniref:phiSA1p31-related protein n=1 Tax=Streptomyces sp. NPDC056352 TaxID=3345791 RepID=UPI0035DBF996
MTTYLHDGVVFDLTVPHMDVTGIEWEWTGDRDEHGAPLLVALGSKHPVPLPDVYHDHGPLIPIRPRSLPTAAQFRAAVDVDPNYAASVASGLYETAPQFRERIAAQPAPVPTAAGHIVAAPSPLQQSSFRAFISSLNRGTRNA